MNRVSAGRAFAVALCAAAIACSSAATPRIAETVVTASRIGVTDQLVVVLDDEALARTGFHVAGLLAGLPGLALSTAGPHGALTQARVRGAEANHLLVLIDGVPANDPAGGAEFEFGGLDPAGIERIEYLPGPQSAVWGSDALAGVLHIRTVPRTGRRRLALAFGSDNTLDADASWARVDERGYATASAGRHRTDGSNAALQGTEKDGFDRTALQLGGGRQVGAWRLSASARGRTGRTAYDPLPAPLFIPADGDYWTDTDFTALQATAARGGDALAMTYGLGSARTARANFADGASASSTVGRRDTASLAANFPLLGQRANLTAEFATATFRQTASATAYGDPNQRQRMNTASLAGEVQGEFGPVAVMVSARHDANDVFDDSFAYRLGAAAGTAPRWFASIGHGVKNPTFIERFGYAPNTFKGNPQLAPETAIGFEAGARWAWQHGGLAIAAFHAVLDDEIDGFYFDTAQGAFTARNLEGRSKRRGVEFHGHAEAGRLRFEGSYSFVRSEAAGERELRRPRHLAKASLHHRISPRLRLGATALHNGSAWDRDFATWPATFVQLDAFRLLRVDAEYAATPRWRWQFIVENALDANYATVYGYGSPGRAAMLRLQVGL